MKTLLEKNRQMVQTTSKNGRTPLHTACLHSRLEAVQFIIQNTDMIDLNTGSPEQTNKQFIALKTDSCGILPIMDAVRAGSIGILDFLANLNPNSIYHQDIMNRNALHVAAESGQEKVLEHLITVS